MLATRSVRSFSILSSDVFDTINQSFHRSPMVYSQVVVLRLMVRCSAAQQPPLLCDQQNHNTAIQRITKRFAVKRSDGDEITRSAGLVVTLVTAAPPKQRFHEDAHKSVRWSTFANTWRSAAAIPFYRTSHSLWAAFRYTAA
jgi:hypothetical protein